jgi:hypothetical protein
LYFSFQKTNFSFRKLGTVLKGVRPPAAVTGRLQGVHRQTLDGEEGRGIRRERSEFSGKKWPGKVRASGHDPMICAQAERVVPPPSNLLERLGPESA